MDRKTDTIRRLDLFSACTPGELRWVARHADELVVPAGASVVRAGETAREFVVVLDGPLAGEHYGARGLLTGGAHDRSFTTFADTRLLVFEARVFALLVERAPRAARKLLKLFAGAGDQRALRAVS